MDDLISRKLVMKTLCERRCGNKSKGCPSGFCTESIAVDCIPSAQPEIVRCKDCRWWDKSEDSPFGYCMAMKHGYMSANWEIGIYRKYKGDFYCADGERDKE